MSQITSPLLLNETGLLILQALQDIAARTNIDPKELESIKDRLTELESGVGTGTIYFYDELANTIMEVVADGWDANEFEIVIDGESTVLDDLFFATKCTHVDFGGDAAESGAYLYFYKKSVQLAFYEVIDVYANGELVSDVMSTRNTFTAPEDVHLTLHD